MEEGRLTDRATEAPFPARRVRLRRTTTAEDGGTETGTPAGFAEAGDWWIETGSSMDLERRKNNERWRFDS